MEGVEECAYIVYRRERDVRDTEEERLDLVAHMYIAIRCYE